MAETKNPAANNMKRLDAWEFKKEKEQEEWKQLRSTISTTEDLDLVDHRDQLLKLLPTLNANQTIVIQGRYFEDKTLEQIAQELHVTRERVRQIELKALRKMAEKDRRQQSRVVKSVANVSESLASEDESQPLVVEERVSHAPPPVEEKYRVERFEQPIVSNTPPPVSESHRVETVVRPDPVHRPPPVQAEYAKEFVGASEQKAHTEPVEERDFIRRTQEVARMYWERLKKSFRV